MAGQPRKRVALKAIEAAGGEEFILARVAEGTTIKALAAEVGVSRQFLSTWCNAEARLDRYARARREAAQSHAEDALGIVDNATPETAQVAKLQSDLRRWMASRMDPGSWGETRSPLVSIDLQQMHLEAVKSGVEPLPPPQGEVYEGEFTEVEPARHTDETTSWLD